MRQGLFAIFLIFCAFAGGALVNGPGLDWAQQQLASLSKRLPTNEEEPFDFDEPTVELFDSEQSSSDSESASPRPPAAGAPLPVAGYSPFSRPKAKSEPSEPDAFEAPEAPDLGAGAPVRAPRGPSIASQSAPALTEPTDAPPNVPRDLPKPPPSLMDVAKLRLSDRPGAEPPVVEATRAPSETGPEPDETSGTPTSPTTPEVLWADASDSTAPATPVMPGANATEAPDDRRSTPAADPSVRLVSSGGDSSAATNQGDWADVRRQMEELGVGRFWVDGDFGDTVTFRCVVPVIGDRAVSQHFEAEGNDLISAARVALRRIALWRATEETP